MRTILPICLGNRTDVEFDYLAMNYNFHVETEHFVIRQCKLIFIISELVNEMGFLQVF